MTSTTDHSPDRPLGARPALNDTAAALATAAPGPPRPTRLNTDTLALAAVFIALFAFLAAVFAVALAARAVDEHRAVANLIRSGAPAPSAPVAVSEGEFAIVPSAITVPLGGSLAVTNDGSVGHNLRVVDGPGTPMLTSGASAELDLSTLPAGQYTVVCEVPGHEAAGMKASLTVR